MKKQLSIVFAFLTSLCAVGAFLVLVLVLGSLTGCAQGDTAAPQVSSLGPSAQPAVSIPEPSADPIPEPSAGPSPVSGSAATPPVQPSAEQPPLQSTPAPEAVSQSPFQPSQDPSENGFQAVLLRNAPFVSVDTNQSLTVGELNRVISDDSSVAVQAVKFAVADLDGDGTAEVVLWLKVNEDDAFGFEVLRQQGGQIYGYTLGYRSFMDLKRDGTFSFTSGWLDNGFGTLSFSDKAYTINETVYSQSAYDGDNNVTVSYFVNGQAATQEEYLSAVQRQSEKENALWFDFTSENIVSALG